MSQPITARATAKVLLAVALSALLTEAQTQGMKDFGDRFEGTNFKKNALEDFTIVAIHRDFVPFSKNDNLQVRFFLPNLPKDPGRKVFVQAIELQDSFHYYMQTKNGVWKEGSWNTFSHWPTKDVIDPLGIHSDNMGVVAQYRIANQRPVFLPVDVYPVGKQVSKRTYTIHFVTGQDLQSMEIAVTNSRGLPIKLHQPMPKCNKSFNPNCKLYAASSTQAIDLDLSSEPEGEYQLKLTGHVPGTSAPTSLDLTLYHHP